MYKRQSLPKEIGNLKNLQFITLWTNNLTSIPKEISNLKNLQILLLFGNNLTSLPKEIGNLKNLQELQLFDNNLTSLPKEIGNLTQLRELVLTRNKLKSLPSQIGNLGNLQELKLSSNDLETVPSSIGNLKNLKQLYLDHNKLRSLPDEINNLTNLERLDVTANSLLRIIPKTLKRDGLEVIKNSSTRFELKIVRKPIQRKNVPLNTNRNDPISGYNFRVGNNALYLGYNRYVTENSLLKWIKSKNTKTIINNINTLYSLNSNENVVINPFTRQPLVRKNLTFVKFVKPNTNKKLDKK